MKIIPKYPFFKPALFANQYSTKIAILFLNPAVNELYLFLFVIATCEEK